MAAAAMWFYVEEFKERRRFILKEEKEGRNKEGRKGHCRGEINMPARISPLVEARLVVQSSRSHRGH